MPSCPVAPVQDETIVRTFREDHPVGCPSHLLMPGRTCPVTTTHVLLRDAVFTHRTMAEGLGLLFAGVPARTQAGAGSGSAA